MAKNLGFEVRKEEIGGETQIKIEFTDATLISIVQNYTDIDEIYNEPPIVRAEILFSRLDQLKRAQRRGGGNKEVKSLIEFLTTENKAIVDQVNNLLQKGVATFITLPYILTTGAEVITNVGGEQQGGRIVRTEFRSSFMGTFFTITYEYVTSGGRHLMLSQGQAVIPAFDGVREIAKLPIRPITDEQKVELAKRGEIFRNVAVGAHYQSYQGHQGIKSFWDWDLLRADGRIMVDVGSYYQFDDSERRPDYYDDDEAQPIHECSDDMLWLTDAFLRGFSFMTKRWGRFSVANMSNINFRKEAYDQLVLEPSKKTLIRSLVQNASKGFGDIIDSKGGGCIFLLHGTPGVGKTLTAEAIAELLERPLYSVSVGELGVTPEQLEKNLRQILDVAQVWNAVILIDEADIFLEKRTEGDILRNAMVGIFLRLLEYHQGVMFLTTNRVRDFDEAFHSRISVALKYEPLTPEARRKIWTNLLEAAGIKDVSAEHLSVFRLNGRQIKNTIRLAQALAFEENVPVTFGHIERTLEVTLQFERDLKN